MPSSTLASPADSPSSLLRAASLRFGLGVALVTPFARDGAVDLAGVDLATQVLAGVAASSVEDAAAQANQLYDAGGRGILLAPPFYFKGVDDEGVFRWLASVIE